MLRSWTAKRFPRVFFNVERSFGVRGEERPTDEEGRVIYDAQSQAWRAWVVKLAIFESWLKADRSLIKKGEVSSPRV